VDDLSGHLCALYASHFTLLRVPYYWDEAGYYIQRRGIFSGQAR